MDDDSKVALDAWEAVVNGSSSLIEWFDTGTRRFIVMRPNPPGTHDPRGLTSLEREVAHYVARGDANKVVAGYVGLPKTRVSKLVRSVLDKLRLRTRAQLVYWVRGLGLPVSGRDAPRGRPQPRKPASLPLSRPRLSMASEAP